MAYAIKQKCSFLDALGKSPEPMRAVDVGELIGIDAYNAGQLANQLRLSKLIEWASKAKHLYRITEKGKKYLANPPAEIEAVKSVPAPPSAEESAEKSTEKSVETVPPQITPADETLMAIPSQADIFKSIGERLGFAKSVSDKRELSLGTVVDYVRSLADMDDLDSIERNLIEQNVPKDIRTRWLKLYAQSLPAKDVEMSPELKERLGLQEGEEKPARGRKREPQFYNVVGGRMYPDPEGEHTFSHALQLMAIEKGASATQAAELAASLAKTPTEIITTLLPLLTREPTPPPTQDNTMILALQARIEQLADGKHEAEMASLRAEMKSGQRSPESDQQAKAFTQQINDLKESLHNEQLVRIQEQNQNSINALVVEMNKLKEQIVAGVQGKQAESKIGLMSETVKLAAEEIRGARQDAKAMVPAILTRLNQGAQGAPVKKRSANEKAGFGTGLDKGIEKARAASSLEDELFFGNQS